MNKSKKVAKTPQVDLEQLQLLDVPEVMTLLSVCRSSVYVLMDRGEIESVKVLNARRVLAVSIQAYIERQRKVA